MESLSGTACLRFAYNDVDRPQGKAQDAGMDSGQAATPVDAGDPRDGAQLSAAGSSGSGGSGGRSVMSSGGTTGGHAAGGSSGGAPSDAGALDASQMDASTSLDAGAPDAGTDSGSNNTLTAPCDRSDLLYCNPFDKDPYDGIEYYIDTNATAVLSTSIKYSGIGSMRASIPAKAGSAARFATRALNHQTSGEFWLRYYYYLPSTPQITTFFSAGVASELTDPYDGFDLQVYSDHVRIESMIGYSADGPTFPRDRWVCVELHATLSTSNGYFEAYFDGTRAARVGPGNTVPSTGFTAAEFGIHYADKDQGAVVVYVDEAMVDTVRIPCN